MEDGPDGPNGLNVTSLVAKGGKGVPENATAQSRFMVAEHV